MSTDAGVIFAELQCQREPAERATMADIDLLIAEDNARLRRRFLDEVATYTVAELTQLTGDPATPRRWLSDRRIFSVPVDDGERLPAFQVADGRPLPVIGEVLAVLPATRSAWEIAFWFVSSNSWLGGPAPVDHLADRNAVLTAARHENDEIAG